MSLVEKALRKLQTTRPTAPPPAMVLPKVGTMRASEPRPAPESGAARSPVAAQPSALLTHSGKALTLNRQRLLGLDMLPPESQEREIAAQLRTIKRPLISYAFEPGETAGAPRHTIMVASALPGDGKTFTSLNLALSLAMELDLTVLLVDADALKPQLTRALQLEREPGLLDLLSKPELRVEDAILTTDVPRLYVLPAGTPSDTAAELLASARMSDLVAHLAALCGHGIVLFDSPPVLLTNESRSLSAMVGQVVLVVRAGVTPQQAVVDAVSQLGEGRHINVVLNGADLKGPAGYYYGYRYGYEQATPAAAAAAASEQPR
jgi:protein-tyrosine kinase